MSMRSKSNVALKIFLLLLFVVTVFSCLSFGFVQTVYADSESIYNTVLFVQFADEEEDIASISSYRSITESFETYFNTGDYSVKSYYNLNSNGKLDVQTPIIKDSNSNLKIYTTTKPRSYYLPYIVLADNEYSKNPDGYFEYYLIQSPKAPTQSYYPTFFDNCKLIAKVFEKKGNIGEDTDLTDGIISLNYATQLRRQHSSDYYLIKSNERLFREYDFVCDVMSQAGQDINSTIADKDGDGIIDSLSFILLDGQMMSGYYSTTQTTYKTQYNNHYYGELLWPHKVGMGFMYENFAITLPEYKEHYVDMFEINMNYSAEEARRIVEYLYSMPTTANGLRFDTISISNSNLTQMSTQQDWEVFVTSNSTFCHEFGHILGLPDLYTGSGDTDTVGYWSQMCGNPPKNSYFTSYEREKFGWLTADNIPTISQAGVYQLTAVKGNDGNNVVAYKVADQTNENRFLYLEYRSIDGEYYDTQCGNRSGLLLYTVNTTKQDVGNSKNRPYEVYVQRKSGVDINNATLQEGDTLGSKTTGADSIKFDTDNSELIVTVLWIDGNNLIFYIEGGELGEGAQPYSVADFDGNATLYRKLYSNLPQGQESLTQNCFVGVQYLDLSDCNLTDLSFLTLFNLSTVKYYNLSHNLLDNQSIISIVSNQDFATLIQNNVVKKMILTGNNIDLSSLSNQMLTNPIFCFGFQLVDFENFSTTGITIPYYLLDNTFVKLKLNDTYLPLSTAGSATLYNVTVPNNYTLVEEVIFNEQTTEYETEFSVVSVTSRYPTEESRCVIMQNSTPASAVEFWVNIVGISKDELSFMFTLPSTRTKTTGTFNVYVKYNNENIFTCIIYYEIYSKPTVAFNSGKDLYIEEFSEYVEGGLTVYEDSTIVEYTQSSGGTARTYYIEGYYKGAVLNTTTNEVDYSNSVKYAAIDTSIRGKYLVRYILCDSNLYVFEYYNYVTVTAGLIAKTEFDSVIYNALTTITGRNAVAKDDFYEYSYINLVSISTTSIKGLKLLELKQDVVIDLSCNELTDMQEIKQFISTYPNSKLILISNNFTRTSIQNLTNAQRNKLVLGLQNVEKISIVTTMGNNPIADYYDDFADYYSVSYFPVASVNIENNMVYFENFGQFSITFRCLVEQNQFVMACTSIGIISKNEEVIKEYSDQFDSKLSNYFIIVGVAENRITTSINSNVVNLSEIGEKTITFTVSYLTKQIYIPLTVTVVDTQAPVITYEGIQNVYVNSYDEYFNSFAQFVVSARDGYDGRVAVTSTGSVGQDIGKYTIEYSAVDSSGNISTLVRTVSIGKCELSSNEDTINYNSYFAIPVKFTVFDIDDFDIFYKLSTQDTFITYDNQTGMICSILGPVTFDFRLVHKYNENLTYEFTYSAESQDISAPVITLIGESQIDIYINSTFVDEGIVVTDNSTTESYGIDSESTDIVITVGYQYLDDQTLVSVENINTHRIGTYIITYTATDLAQNTSSKQRTVVVKYYAITNIDLRTEDITMSKYNIEQSVNFIIDATPFNQIDPDTSVIWYVNGEQYEITNTFTISITFSKTGSYKIRAVLENNPEISTQELNITIYKESSFSATTLVIVAVVAVLSIMSIVALFVGIHRRRKIY